ncbi:unnamed protein product, partial [Sphenostylis stenocarpa]
MILDELQGLLEAHEQYLCERAEEKYNSEKTLFVKQNQKNECNRGNLTRKVVEEVSKAETMNVEVQKNNKRILHNQG